MQQFLDYLNHTVFKDLSIVDILWLAYYCRIASNSKLYEKIYFGKLLREIIHEVGELS